MTAKDGCGRRRKGRVWGPAAGSNTGSSFRTETFSTTKIPRLPSSFHRLHFVFAWILHEVVMCFLARCREKKLKFLGFSLLYLFICLFVSLFIICLFIYLFIPFLCHWIVLDIILLIEKLTGNYFKTRKAKRKLIKKPKYQSEMSLKPVQWMSVLEICGWQELWKHDFNHKDLYLRKITSVAWVGTDECFQILLYAAVIYYS